MNWEDEPIVEEINVDFSIMLSIIYVALKLGKVISISWLWALSPIWINIILQIVNFLFYELQIVFLIIIDYLVNKYR